MTAHTLLIVGENKTTRHDKATDIAKEFLGGRLSKFDLLEISNEETDKISLGIEVSRQIINFLKEKPIERSAKGVIIHEAGSLTTEAQNALLKTLEEPPLTSFLILTTSKKTDLLPTVLSRCQIVSTRGRPTFGGKLSPLNSSYFSNYPYLPKTKAEVLDFVLENKETLEDKTHTLTFLEQLENSLRQEILAGRATPKSAETLWKTRERVAKMGANSRLAIEEWLLNK